jgi:thiol:disulfide interchange protein DsbD
VKAIKVGVLLISMLVVHSGMYGQTERAVRYRDMVEITGTPQHETVKPGSRSAVALNFKVQNDWHFYADAKTAPGGMSLKITPSGQGAAFNDPILPESHEYFDKSLSQKLQVYSGRFTIYLPFTVDTAVSGKLDISIAFKGALCSESLCQMASFPPMQISLDVDSGAAMDKGAFDLPAEGGDKPAADAKVAKEPDNVAGAPNLTGIVGLSLAVLAGLLLNVMPCVWPVLPIIIERLVEQGRESSSRRIAMGLAFCAGIMLFFAAFAAVNVVLRVGFDTALQWSEHLRQPPVLITTVLLMVVLAMFMFGVFTFGIPSSMTGGGRSGKGLAGSVATGFGAAVLATPCSFGILSAALIWAQAQDLLLGTVALLLIGVGMAAPYLVLVLVPSLLASMPRPGRWMELIKQGLGFVLLAIAVKFLASLPETQKMGTLYCVVAVAFAVWMWGGWVTYSTPRGRKWTIRLLAVLLAAGSCAYFLPARTEPIDWQPYDAQLIAEAKAKGQPVLIEFMAEWCLSCKAVEKIVYHDKEIVDLIERKNILAVRGDTTLDDYQATIDLINVYDEPAVPVSILLLPGRDEPVRLRGVIIGGKLKGYLRELADFEHKQ